MEIWDCQIVFYGSPEYQKLRLDGWEPFHFELLPMPPNLAIPDGQVSAEFCQAIGMRKRGIVE